MWSTLGHTPLIGDGFLVGWRFALRHSQFASSLGLWWIKSCRMTLHWGHSHSRGHFLLEIQSPYSIFYIVTHSTHWWLIFEMMVHFETRLLQRLHVLGHSPLVGYGLWFIWEHKHFRWFIQGHSHFIHIHIAQRFWFIRVMLRCFIFGSGSWDWLICWRILGMIPQ